jgi:predicted amidohydrolase YtcJ
MRTVGRSLQVLLLGLVIPAATFASNTLLIHGHIYTGNPKAPWAEAIAISGEKIDAVGSDKEILSRRDAKSVIVDLHGKTVIPGITDSHMHLLFGALALHGVNLSTPQASITQDTPDVLIEKIKTYAANHSSEKILFGRADFSTVPPGTPTHALLDRAVTDRPLIVHNTSEHALWLNAKALALVGIGDTPVADPIEERNVLRDASGHATGILLENAMEIAERAAMTQLPRDEKLAMLRDALHYLNGLGITSVTNATGNPAELELYAALHDRGELTIRTRTSFASVAVNHHLTPEFLADLETARSKYRDDWVSANLVKFFLDGGTGMIPPLTYEPAEYKKLVLELDKRGFQIMSHALRSDTVRLALDAYEQAAKANGKRDRRFRVEHADILTEEDLPRFAKLNVVASMQPVFCCSDIGANFDASDKTPTDRWQSLKESGATVAFGSDWPCTWPPNPFVAMQQAVTRTVWRNAATSALLGGVFDGAGQGGAVPTQLTYVAEERLSIEQAVSAYTRGSAFANFTDHRLGTLETGKLADLAVLSQDIFSAPLQEMSKTQVVLTMVGGKIVFHEEK